MVQQDFGESVDNHGYVVWNVQTKEHKHVNLESDYGFYTFKINSIEDIEEEMKVGMSYSELDKVKDFYNE